jgi:hypothetical protein
VKLISDCRNAIFRGNALTEALTERLLAFSHEQPVSTLPVDLTALLNGMIDTLARTLGSRHPN